MSIRRATQSDEPILRRLWEELGAEVPDRLAGPETWQEEWAHTRRDLASGSVFLAEDDDGAVGVARAEAPKRGTAHVHVVHVRPRSRRHGVAKELLAEVVRDARERGAARVSLGVLATNELARSVWQRLGFEEVALVLAAPAEALEHRLSSPVAATFGSVHVQTDDRDAVVRAVEKYRPRFGPPGGGEVSEPRGGWVAVYDELCERDPKVLQRLARELSLATGAVVVTFTVEEETAVGYSIFERGTSVDDYLSVPEFRGPLPPGDVVALAANPRVVQRLTGADPAAVRAVVRTAQSAAELPPARELAGEIGKLMGIVGADRGYGG